MKLVKTVEIKKTLRGIYELNDAQTEAYGGKYFLSRDLFSKDALKMIDEGELLSGCREYYYEGFFDTVREATLYAKLAEARITLQETRQVLLEALKTVNK